MSQLTITGNSHTIALNQGLRQVPEAAGVTVFGLGAGVYETEAFSATEAGRVVLTQPVYAENLVRFTGQDHIAPDRLWGICMGTHNPRLYGDRIWTGAAAPSALAGDGQRPVSSGLIDRMADEDQRHIRAFLTQLKDAGIRFFVISAPPVRADHQNIVRGADPEVLLEIDRRSRARFRGFLDGLGVDFVDFPPETADAQGLLRPEYAAGLLKNGKRDPHHGNAEYGALMLRRILAEVGQPA
ncbi:hypothetical protein JF540_24805 [Salipiger thiooxidans]|uniref:hypothetical protein n=1 Tax=Salipiger thiooxidans TaxID=282683 RepID=UPI001A8E9C37|nr:hypothetical protein [Salipiger thiooxidans]MBN8189911.1 hypothetical protein [Salipiger thiooxidans]